MNDEPLPLLIQAATGDFSPAVLAFCRDGLRRYLEHGGTLPLERCFRLPTTPAKLSKAQRDYWLRQAWEAIEAPSDWRRSVCLAEEIKRFENLGIWGRWRDRDTPPDNVSKLNGALFYAFRASADMPRTAVGIDKVIRGSH